MAFKVAVSNLSKDTTDERFKEVFGAFGKLDQAGIIRDRDSTSRGFGFIDYTSEENVDAAIKALHETELDGNKIRVARAR